jgi:polyisoprenoid-binding protein YceI
MLKSFATIALPIALASGAVQAADIYQFDAKHTQIRFDWNHLTPVTLTGFFTKYQGELSIDFDKPEKSFANVTLDLAGLWTGVEKFDGHLKSKDFFEAEKFPTVTFKSTKIVKTGDTTGTMTGNLTIKGVTKSVTFDLSAPAGFEKRKMLGFIATAKVKRSELGLGFLVPKIPDDVTIVIATEVINPAAP